MKLNFQGRIGNVILPFSRALLPVFEGLVNAIHSIEDAGRNDGAITLWVRRATKEDRQPMLTGDRLTSRSIVGFSIEDNGIGFNAANYESFETSDSDHKKARGAKGVGRFLWLKAFRRVRVTSVFEEGGSWFERRFSFSLDANGTSDHELVATLATERRTVVELLEVDTRYEKECPRLSRTIAERVIEHCLSYLLHPNCPRFTLRDDDEPATLDINDVFEQEVSAKAKRTKVTCRDVELAVQHVRVFAGEFSQHTIHLCANERDVQHFPLVNAIPYVPPRLKGSDEEPFVYKAYVSSNFLDRRVNAERTGFNFAQTGDLQASVEPTEKEILNAVVDAASTELGPLLSDVEEKIRNRVEELVEKRYPEYRPILNEVDSHIREFKDGASDQELLTKLNEIQFREDIEAREQAKELLAEKNPDVRNSEKYQRLQRSYARKAHEIAQSRLAQCVIHRKIILDLLEWQLSATANGKYPKEEKVHELIFPMRCTSDDIQWQQQNLWIIDERLAYHRFLASDRPISAFSDQPGNKEPDLFVLNHPAAFAASGDRPVNSAVIVEFKRAERATFNENPVAQVLGYVRRLRDSNIKDNRGRTVQVHPQAIFYCYIIADLTPQLRSFAEESFLDPTPDSAGYFGFNRNYKAYVEIISYDKLLNDSQSRNRELFKALELE